MADTSIQLPQLGETVTEGTILKWLKSVGESVELDEPLYEISTDKVDTEVPSPVAGVLKEILVGEGDTAEVGTVLGVLDSGDATGGDTTSDPAMAKEAALPTTPSEPTPAPAPTPIPAASPASTAPSAKTSSTKTRKVTSPLVRRLIRTSGVDESIIVATGSGDRVTKKDVENAIAATSGATKAGSTTAKEHADPSVAPLGFRTDPPAKTSIPLSRIRKLTAEHMRMSKATSAHVLTAVEVDFENLERVRQAHRPVFKADEGISLTYLPFIIRAVSDTIAKYPHMNASIVDDELIVPNYVNMGVAVDLSFEGLVAPVIKNADAKPLRELAREIVDLAGRARSKKLMPDDLSGGTFTITNPGQYGTLMQFAIINQPQVAILSTDGVRRKPVVVTSEIGEESIAIHSVGVLALSWDHRAFDGAYAAAFLNHLRKIIEGRDWEAEL